MGSGGSSLHEDKHVLIIGAGYGGVQLALTLMKKKANFTIVDQKECLHHNVAAVRAIIQPGFAKKTVIPYEPTFGSHFRRGKVTKIDVETKQVTLEDGTELTYDILVIASGSVGPMKESEGSCEEIIAKYSKVVEQVKESHDVVVVGGGPVGVEVAAEVATIYPDKKVTVIHGGKQLINPEATHKFIEKVTALLKDMRVEVLLDDNVENLDELPDQVHGSYEVKTQKGKTVHADIILKCTGLKPNSSSYSSGLSSHMTENGFLKVNEHLQVEGLKEVFAFGDCSNTKEPKLAYVAKLQADLVAKNLANLINKQPLDPWKSDAVKIFMGLSMGSRHGVLALKSGFVLPEFIIVNVKSKDMMTGSYFQDMHQKVPA